jgi:hypothetical protein
MTTPTRLASVFGAFAATLAVSAALAPDPAHAQRPAPTPDAPLTLATLDAFCDTTVFVDRLGPSPAIDVTEAILLEALAATDRKSACRWRAGMLLGYFGSAKAPAVLMNFVRTGFRGPLGNDEYMAVLGALHGLGIYVRSHPGAPETAVALEFLVDATAPTFWLGGDITWSRPGATPDASGYDAARSALIGLGLTGSATAWNVLDAMSTDHRIADELADRARFSLGLWCEARASLDPT